MGCITCFCQMKVAFLKRFCDGLYLQMGVALPSKYLNYTIGIKS